MKTTLYGRVIEVGGGRIDIELDSGRLICHADKQAEVELASQLYKRVCVWVDVLPEGEPRRFVDERSIERMQDLLTEMERSSGITGVRVAHEDGRIVITAPGGEQREAEICRIVADEVLRLGFEHPKVSEMRSMIATLGKLLWWMRDRIRHVNDALDKDARLVEWIDQFDPQRSKENQK